MPNYIKNKLVIHGTNEQINKVKDFLRSKEYKDENDEYAIIDLNNITPMPKWVYSGNLGNKEEEKYGKENCWYEWSIKNWGTKWNAFRASENENSIEWETAWDGIPELISKLGVIFPDIEFDYYFADEDIGYNIGSFTFKDTEITDNSPIKGSKEAYELAINLWHREDRWIWNEDKQEYEYKEE